MRGGTGDVAEITPIAQLLALCIGIILQPLIFV
jgi:hypothetical protein